MLRRQDGTRLLCCLERSMNDVGYLKKVVRDPGGPVGANVAVLPAPGVSDSPDGVDGVLADSHRYAVRDGSSASGPSATPGRRAASRWTSSPPRRPPSDRDRRLRSARLRGVRPRVRRRSFSERRELGAAVAAYVGGEKVVDLWGRPSWQRDTLVLVYSTSKGLSAMTLALLHSRGLLDYDERVSTYWPEFARAGKEQVTVRQLLAHEAGLPVIDEPLDAELLADFDRLADAIAGQQPRWTPGEHHGYHGVSLGWYEGELVRRIDPQHRSLGRFFAEEIAAPLGSTCTSEFRTTCRASGSPGSSECRCTRRRRRCATCRGRMAAAMVNPRSLSYRAFANPRLPLRPTSTATSTGTSSSPPAAAPWAARAASPAPTRRSPAPRRRWPVNRDAGGTVLPRRRARNGWRDRVLKVDTAFSLGFARPLKPVPVRLPLTQLRAPGAGGVVRLRRPRPRRVVRLRDEPARLPPERRPAREAAARRALPLPLSRGSPWRQSVACRDGAAAPVA